MTRYQSETYQILSKLSLGTEVVAHGGDVMRFAGDSMICAFLPTPTEAETFDKGLAAATLRSVQCAHILSQDLGVAHHIQARLGCWTAISAYACTVKDPQVPLAMQV